MGDAMFKLGIALALLLVPSETMAADATVTLKVDNMTCALCPITVRKAIKSVAGVKDVTIDFEHNLAIVSFDDAATTVDMLAAASRDAGYPATRKE